MTALTTLKNEAFYNKLITKQYATLSLSRSWNSVNSLAMEIHQKLSEVPNLPKDDVYIGFMEVDPIITIGVILVPNDLAPFYLMAVTGARVANLYKYSLDSYDDFTASLTEHIYAK